MSSQVYLYSAFHNILHQSSFTVSIKT